MNNWRVGALERRLVGGRSGAAGGTGGLSTSGYFPGALVDKPPVPSAVEQRAEVRRVAVVDGPSDASLVKRTADSSHGEQMADETWFEVTVETWEQFEAELGKFAPADPTYPDILFRGQPVFEWTLKPSICRLYPEEFTALHGLWVEFRAIGEFKRRAHLYLDPKFLPSKYDIIEWLHNMQQHHAPTRLLDWTFSSYVALYFAVESNHDADGAIWYFSRKALKTGSSQLYGEKYRWFDARIEEKRRNIIRSQELDSVDSMLQYVAFSDHDAANMVFAYEPSDGARASERIVAQQGTFTYSKAPKSDHADAIYEAVSKACESQNEMHSLCGKIKIPSRLKKAMLQRLNQMNINSSSLFPGIDGLGRSISGLVNIQCDWLLNTHESFVGRKS
jgi:hypothetical protein